MVLPDTQPRRKTQESSRGLRFKCTRCESIGRVNNQPSGDHLVKEDTFPSKSMIVELITYTSCLEGSGVVTEEE